MEQNRGMAFKEKQYFRQWWLWVLMIVATLGTVGLAISDFLENDGVWKDEMLTMTLAAVFVLILTIFLWVFRLDTTIDKDGIRVKFAPFPMATQHFTWAGMSKCYVRQYNPLAEYGGWGYKGTGKNRAYNTSGSDGLQIVLDNGRKVLIGTQRPEELTAVLYKLGVVKV